MVEWIFFRYPELIIMNGEFSSLHCIVPYSLQTPDRKLVRVFVLSCAVCTLQRDCRKVDFEIECNARIQHETRNTPSNWMRIFNIIFNSTLRYSKLQYVICYGSVCIVQCEGSLCHGEHWNGFIDFTLNISDNRCWFTVCKNRPQHWIV